jgi:integral membrane sensor domain MASE1
MPSEEQQFRPVSTRLAQSQIMHWVLAGTAYYCAGRLALLLAIPPGYATAVWPGAGIALAAVLIWGYRVCPAIVLGSFLLNFWTSQAAAGGAVILRTTLVTISIGAGAALQAAAGALLLRRLIGFPTAFRHRNEVVKFLLLGPGSCLVGASIGVSTLMLGKFLRAEDFLSVGQRGGWETRLVSLFSLR